MYDESKLLDIILEYYSLLNLYSYMDHFQEIVTMAVCKKYNMVIVPMKENGSEIVLAQIGSSKGINITIHENIAMSFGIQSIPEELWKNGKRSA